MELKEGRKHCRILTGVKQLSKIRNIPIHNNNYISYNVQYIFAG